MKYIPILFVLIFFRLITVSAQVKTDIISFENLGGYGEERFPFFIPTPDGGFLASIYTLSNGGSLDFSCGKKVRTVYRKYDTNGVFTGQWCKLSQGINIRTLPKILPSGNIFYVHNIPPIGSNAPQRLRFEKEDTAGNLLMKKELGPTQGTCALGNIISTTDGGFLFTASINLGGGDVIHEPADLGKKNSNLWVVKIDTNANILWQQIIGGSHAESIPKIALAPDGGYYIAANSRSSDFDCKCSGGKGYEIFIARLDSLGDILWSRCMGSVEDNVWIADIVEDGTGGLYVASTAEGKWKDLSGVHIGLQDFWVIHLDKDNKLLLNKCYGSVSGREFASDIEVAKDRTIWLTGYINKPDFKPSGREGMIDTIYGESDAWVIKIDSTGQLLYSKTLGTLYNDRGYHLYSLHDSSVVVCGLYAWPKDGGNMPLIHEGGISDAFITRFGTPKPNGVISEGGKLQNNIHLYPNPAQDKMYIKNTAQQDSRIQISDINGRTVSDIIIKPGATQIDVQDWPRGVYILKSSDENGHQSFHKFTKL